MALLKRDAHHYTYADYLTWSNSYGEELIDGTAYVREPPGPSASHQRMVVGLCCQIEIALEHTPWRVYVAPFDVRLPKSVEEDDQIDTHVGYLSAPEGALRTPERSRAQGKDADRCCSGRYY